MTQTALNVEPLIPWLVTEEELLLISSYLATAAHALSQEMGALNAHDERYFEMLEDLEQAQHLHGLAVARIRRYRDQGE